MNDSLLIRGRQQQLSNLKKVRGLKDSKRKCQTCDRSDAPGHIRTVLLA